MAKQNSKTDDLVELLRARGLRRQVAKQIADATTGTRKRTPKQVLTLLDDLRKLADDLEDRITGGPAKRKAAAKKAAATRKRAATKRSTAAKKGAQTRAKKAATTTRRTASKANGTAKRSTSSRAKSTSSRSSAKAKR
jgi:DNA replication initiation complex subunit (GINS family)